MQKSFQTDTAMTQHLGTTLATINAIRGSSGADITSPSGEAIENRTLALGNQDIARTTINIQEKAKSTNTPRSTILARRTMRLRRAGSPRKALR